MKFYDIEDNSMIDKSIINNFYNSANKIQKIYYKMIYNKCNLITTKEGVEKLYKFISFNSDEKLNTEKMNTFAKGYLYASSPLYFNDPYDCELSFNIMDNYDDFKELVFKGLSLNREERRKFKNKEIEREVRKFQKEITTDWEKLKKEIAVCCFTEHVDNFLMWSHYANCYNGICLEYDKNEIKDYLLAAVKYTNQLESAIKNISANDLQNENYMKLYMSAIRSVFSKQIQWSYEKEWRIVISVNSNNDQYIHMPVPKKLYIGFKLDNNIEKEVILKAKQLGIPEIVKTRISTKEYKLIHEPIK